MILSFLNDKIKEYCEDFNLCEKRHGTNIADRIFQRLEEMHIAEHMNEFINLPVIKLESVKHESPFVYSVNLTDNAKLIFKLKQEMQSHLANNESINEIEIIDILI